MNFFAWLNDQEQGPLNEETVQTMIANGQIPNDTLLRLEDNESDWIAAKDLFPQGSSGSFSLKISEEESVEVQLNSGEKLKIKAVRLYDEVALAKVSSKKSEAIKMLQGVSTGIGAWGSIEWVLATSVVIGAVESVLSAGASSSGAKLLKEAIYAERQLWKEGVFFPTGKIQSIESPIPGFWRAFSKKANATAAFVHNGDEFVVVQADDDSTCSIRWNAVERYNYSKPK